VPDGEIEAASLEWARRIARGPTTAQRYMKANVRAALRLDLDAALVVEAEHMIRSTRTAEHAEAVRAWMDQRGARLSGVNADGPRTG
jgi:2-(1,2-epoxy-1,2-dihydrophenyl)acetyl-CoA isomerase